MNTRNDTPTRIRISPEETQPQVARQPQRRKPNPVVMRSLQLGMLASGAVIVVLALMMLLIPMIKINRIVVEGNSYYDDATVAQKAGIAVGDIILFFNGNRIAQSEDLTTALYACTAGDQVEIIIYRAGLQYSATVTIDQAN